MRQLEGLAVGPALEPLSLFGYRGTARERASIRRPRVMNLVNVEPLAVYFPGLPKLVIPRETPMPNEQTVSQLLEAAEKGDRAALQQLFSVLYDELRYLAHRVRSSGYHTLNTTSLVHEAYLKLVPSSAIPVRDRVHFFRLAARAMRQVLVDAARRRSTRDRGQLLLGVEATLSASDQVSVEVLDLEDALVELEELSPRQARVVECRYFAGLTNEETAAALGVSVPTVKRDWRVARAWLAQALSATQSTITPG